MGKANARPYGAMWLLADALMSWTWDPPRSDRCQSLLLDDRLLSMAGLYGLWRDRSQDIYGSRQLVGCRLREKTHQPYRSWRGPQPATSAVAVFGHHTQQPHSRVGYSADPLVCSSDRCLRKLGNGQQDDGIFQRLQFMTVVGNDEQISR